MLVDVESEEQPIAENAHPLEEPEERPDAEFAEGAGKRGDD
jgi:hypothetical protein